MNPLLQVKLRFDNESNAGAVGTRNLRKNDTVSVEKLDALIKDLNTVKRFYNANPRIIRGLLIDVCYNDIIAKSNRIREVLKPVEKSTNDAIVGARFSDAEVGKKNHIITYYIDWGTIDNTIEELRIAQHFLKERLGGEATAKNFNEIQGKKNSNNISYDGFGFSKSKLRDLIVDCSVIDSFKTPHISTSQIPDRDTFLLTFYKTELNTYSLLENLGIDDHQVFSYGEDTISVTYDLFSRINDKAPYLISMISGDISEIEPGDILGPGSLPDVEIPEPNNEPVIGVIDTLFDKDVYFNEWVENKDALEDWEKINIPDGSREHGTEVTSIIVDGPRMNPWLDDGCGRFRVRHFGVCTNKISISRLTKKIIDIVDQNPDIHVWNLSLGTEDEISKNFISYDAAALDELQYQKNIIFVISGTNDNNSNIPGEERIGSPADSLNSLVVNSVKRNGQPASYSRRGNVLSFFNKPDVSYYGGDVSEKIFAYSPTCGETLVCGTSFAAPWISRKMCYLMDVIGLPREIAKSLIIDSAAGWEYKRNNWRHKDLIGYGIVPIDINKVLMSENEEIKFYLYGSSESYRTANYSIPIPRNSDDKYPYIARATLCYFPKCNRSQGVDYTCRELSLKFGRIKDDGSIADINDNVLDEEGAHVDERESRNEFRKWENTKFISKRLKNNQSLKSYGDRQWGIRITSNERLSAKMQSSLNFGVVITLKEIKGVNRIQDFIKACSLRGWIVNEINVENKVEVYNVSQEEIVFD